MLLRGMGRRWRGVSSVPRYVLVSPFTVPSISFHLSFSTHQLDLNSVSELSHHSRISYAPISPSGELTFISNSAARYSRTPTLFHSTRRSLGIPTLKRARRRYVRFPICLSSSASTPQSPFDLTYPYPSSPLQPIRPQHKLTSFPYSTCP